MLLSSKPKLFLAFALAFLVLFFGALRLNQLVIRQSASDVRFGPTINHLTWNSATGELTHTGGDDPYAFLQIPADSLPLDELVLECRGTPPPGYSFVYPSPAYLPDTIIDDHLAVSAQIEPTSEGFRMRFPLGGSKIARLDLPDELTTPLLIHEVTFRTHFLVGGNPTFRCFATSLGALVLLLIWILTGPLITRSRAAEVMAIVVLVAAKLWLSGGMHMTIYADARHDDALFMAQGHSIANGDWLGRLDDVTLSKGPSYSVFIALVQLSRIPLLDAQTAFHALACVLLVLALRPLVGSPGIRLLLLAVLLFDPHSYSSEAGERALRSGIQPALTLLTLAGVIGMSARLNVRARALLPWALLGGGALAAFWFSREEGIWLVPTLVLISGGALWQIWREDVSVTTRLARTTCFLLPAILCLSALWILRAVNHHYYHAWISVDVKDGGFPAAYGALTRITPATLITGVPVTKETRLRAYVASPAFAELQPVLEGETGRAWAAKGWEGLESHPSAGREMRGGWFQWALRQAALERGYYKDAEVTSRYWQRVADEINAACENGQLAAGPRRSGFFPRWESSLWKPLGQSLIGAAAVVVRISDFKSQAYPSRGSPERVAQFSRVLHEPPVMSWLPPTLHTHLSIVLFHCYQNLGVPVTILAVVCALILAGRSFRRSSRSVIHSVIVLGLLGGAAALIVIAALVDVTSFSALHSMYLCPATPLALSAWVLAPYWTLRRSSSDKSDFA